MITAVQMPRRYLYKAYQIDANRINARHSLPFMNRLEQWDRDEVILLEMSEAAHHEAKAGFNAQRTRKALTRIFSMEMIRNDGELDRKQRIEQILFPQGARNQNELNDVSVVFNAGKYGKTLITSDGGILRHRKVLGDLGISVLTDEEAIQEVELAVQERDELARDVALWTGQELPDWVGKD